jgi:hypothetical protein
MISHLKLKSLEIPNCVYIVIKLKMRLHVFCTMQAQLTCLVMVQRCIYALYPSFNFRHLDLFVFLIDFNIEIPSRVMKP